MRLSWNLSSIVLSVAFHAQFLSSCFILTRGIDFKALQFSDPAKPQIIIFGFEEDAMIRLKEKREQFLKTLEEKVNLALKMQNLKHPYFFFCSPVRKNKKEAIVGA